MTERCLMSVSNLSFSFLDVDSGEASDLPRIEGSFIAYTPEQWREGSGDGIFTCTDDEKGVADLYLIDDGKGKVSVRYNHRKNGERSSVEFYSVGDRSRIDTILDVGEDQFVPSGSLIDPRLAWKVLNEFVSSPHEIPQSVEWISSQDVNWPQDW